MSKSPLVSVGLITYNQRKFVRDALLGAFSQTYSPLEIIISDDSSSDGTWEILQGMVEEYRQNGGVHTIILNRNAKNLGIIGNFLKTFELMHGELLVHAGGDDISYPNRVEIIVREWLKRGKRPPVVYHAADRMDCRGRLLTPMFPYGYDENGGDLHWRSLESVYFFGALMAYRPEVVRNFGQPFIKHGEDFLLGWRSLLLGDPLLLGDKLVKYRVGSGLSSSVFGFRKARIGTVGRALDAVNQFMVDCETICTSVSADRLKKVQDLVMERKLFYDAWEKCLMGRTFAERLQGWRGGGEWLLPFHAPRCVRGLLLLPSWITTPLFALFIFMVQVRRLFIGLKSGK